MVDWEKQLKKERTKSLMQKSGRVGMGKGQGKGYKNITPPDPNVHSMSARGIKQKQSIAPMKPLTARQQQDKFYEDYIIDAIDASGYEDRDPKTKKEKLQFLKNTFRDEFYFEVKKIGEQNAFRKWIPGLPSSFNLEFENYKILKLAKKSGSLPQDATEAQESRVLENYWNFMTVKTFQAFKKYGVE